MSARVLAVTILRGADGFFEADGVAGSMLGAFLSECCDVMPSDVWEADASDGDINGEIVGGCRGLLTNSIPFGDAGQEIVGNPSILRNALAHANMGECGNDMH
jgi:hypothetical protein